MKPSEEIRALMHQVAKGEVNPERATGLVARFGVRMFNAGAQRSSEPTGGLSGPSSAGDPRSPEDGPPATAGTTVAGGQGEAIITHILRRFPTQMSTCCGLSVLHAFPNVTREFAAREDWGGSLPGLAVCVGCATSPVMEDAP